MSSVCCDAVNEWKQMTGKLSVCSCVLLGGFELKLGMNYSSVVFCKLKSRTKGILSFTHTFTLTLGPLDR